MQSLSLGNALLLRLEPVGKLLLTDLFKSLGVWVKLGHNTEVLEWVPLDGAFDLSCTVKLIEEIAKR